MPIKAGDKFPEGVKFEYVLQPLAIISKTWKHGSILLELRS